MGAGEFTSFSFPLSLTFSTIQALKPFYELFLEKKMKEVTTQAVSAATGLSRENLESAMGISRQDSSSSTASKRHAPNGKVKSS